MKRTILRLLDEIGQRPLLVETRRYAAFRVFVVGQNQVVELGVRDEEFFLCYVDDILKRAILIIEEDLMEQSSIVHLLITHYTV